MKALKLSKGVFDYVSNQQGEVVIDELEDEGLREIAYDAGYCVGFCLMELEKNYGIIYLVSFHELPIHSGVY